MSYLLSGEMVHRHSTGAEQMLRTRDVKWMIAGRGVSHSVRMEGDFQQTGRRLELLQAWVAIPVEAEESEPAFFHHGIPELSTFEENGAWSRLIVGSGFGVKAPVKAHSPLFYLHTKLQTGVKTILPQDYPKHAAYVVKGRIEVAGQSYAPGLMLVFAPKAIPVLMALEASTVMLLAGQPVGPHHIWWNFVASSKERIEQAKADWQSGRIVLPIQDEAAFISLP